MSANLPRVVESKAENRAIPPPTEHIRLDNTMLETKKMSANTKSTKTMSAKTTKTKTMKTTKTAVTLILRT